MHTPGALAACAQGLLVWNPFAKAPGSSQLLLETLVKAAQPLDGNSCPYNASNPLQGCPPGYFCPTAAEQTPCPRGYYCPGVCRRLYQCPGKHAAESLHCLLLCAQRHIQLGNCHTIIKLSCSAAATGAHAALPSHGFSACCHLQATRAPLSHVPCWAAALKSRKLRPTGHGLGLR